LVERWKTKKESGQALHREIEREKESCSVRRLLIFPEINRRFDEVPFTMASRPIFRLEMTSTRGPRLPTVITSLVKINERNFCVERYDLLYVSQTMTFVTVIFAIRGYLFVKTYATCAKICDVYPFPELPLSLCFSRDICSNYLPCVCRIEKHLRSLNVIHDQTRFQFAGATCVPCKRRRIWTTYPAKTWTFSPFSLSPPPLLPPSLLGPHVSDHLSP